MTLEDRVERLEIRADELRDLGKLMGERQDKDIAAGRKLTEGTLALCEDVTALKAQVAELDVMVLAIHAAIKDVQERV
ncbi:MAG: hypothetical protein V3W41_12880 [Planctomycetota bacterium]